MEKRPEHGKTPASRPPSSSEVSPCLRVSVLKPSLLDRETLLGPLMVLPAVLLLVGLLAYPLGLAVLFSMTDRRLAATSFNFVGLQNFVELAGDSTFRRVLW